MKSSRTNTPSTVSAKATNKPGLQRNPSPEASRDAHKTASEKMRYPEADRIYPE